MGLRRDYTWFIRDGYFIRSPLSVDGVKISESDRTREEAEWLERQKAREKRAAERAKARGENQASPAEEPASTPPVTVEDMLKQMREPQFVSSAYFLRFKFDPGHYALAGRERLNDRDVLKIEYYPSGLFNEDRTRPNRKLRDKDDEIEEKMNKVSMVTLWIDPDAHQILQYTFDNIDMDFLPGRSLVRVDDLKATMKMSQPFPDVWLPATHRDALRHDAGRRRRRRTLRRHLSRLQACRGDDEDQAVIRRCAGATHVGALHDRLGDPRADRRAIVGTNASR